MKIGPEYNKGLKMTLINIIDAANYLGIKCSTMRHLVFSKKVTVIKVGRLLRFTQKDLDEYIEKQRRPAMN